MERDRLDGEQLPVVPGEIDSIRTSEEYYVPRELERRRSSMYGGNGGQRRYDVVTFVATFVFGVVFIALVAAVTNHFRLRAVEYAATDANMATLQLLAGKPTYPDASFKKEEGGLFHVYYGTGITSGVLLLEVPLSSLERPFVVSATWYRGNADQILLNMPVSGSMDGPNAFAFRIPKSQPEKLELYAPQFYISLENEESPMQAAYQAGTFTGWLSDFDFLPSRTRKDAVLINITPWVCWKGMSVVNGLEDPQTEKRIVSASAFPKSVRVELELAVQSHWDMNAAPVTIAAGIAFTVAALPEKVMQARRADERIGYFVTSHIRLDADRALHSRVDLIQRRSFERHDGEIVYVIDETVPHQWRQVIKEGVEEWNKAFRSFDVVREDRSSALSRANGSRKFVRALLPGDDDYPKNFRVGDAAYSSISWSPSIHEVFALGPSLVDPRSGEILYSHIVITHGWVRSMIQTERIFGSASPAKTERLLKTIARATGGGNNDAGSQIVHQALRTVAMHEVGHTLGLRHNFRGSASYPLSKLSDAEFVETKGLTSSVMDYLPPVFRKRPKDQVAYYTPTLGDYDYLAIQYGYGAIKSDGDLSDIGALAVQKGLHFATDEDLGSEIGDAYTSAWDVSSEPLDFHEETIAVSRATVPKLRAEAERNDIPWFDFSEDFLQVVRFGLRPLTLVTRFVGGFVVTRSRAGKSKLSPNVVSDPKLAQKALDILARELDPVDGLLGSKLYETLETVLVTQVGDSCGVLSSCTGQGPLDVVGFVRQARESVLESLLSPSRLAACDLAHSRSSGQSPSATAVLSRLSTVFISDSIGSAPITSDAASHWITLLIELREFPEGAISPSIRAAVTAQLSSLHDKLRKQQAHSTKSESEERQAILWALTWKTKNFALIDASGNPISV